jgi:hypothetical protein
MLCPFRFAVPYQETDSGTPLVSYNCLKDDCAWWDDNKERCAIASIHSHLEAIYYRLKRHA